MRTCLDSRNISSDVLFMLIDYFNYHIRDVKNFEDLSEDDKRIISRNTLNKIILN